MEHLYEFFLNLGLITAAIVAYLILFRRSTPIKLKGNYKQPAWNYNFRVLVARFAVRRWKKSLTPYKLEDTPRTDLNEGWDCISLRASSPDGVTVLLSIRKVGWIQPIAEVTVYIRLADGTSYRLPPHPKTAVSPWENIAGGWSAGGLKIQVLEPLERLRIIFSGLLIRNDGSRQHVRFNFIWASVSRSVRYPEDWDNSLAAHALALEPWRNQQWPLLLGTYGDGSWMKWGSIQGRFTSFTPQGTVDRTEYVETRGVKERSWSPRAYRGLRRSFAVTAVARDGTAVIVRGFSYKEILTVGLTGNVRLPDYTVHSITGATLEMSEFCEDPDGIPKTYTFHVSIPKKDLAIVLNISTEGGEFFSGIPHRYRTLYRNLSVSINGEIGTGILELGYAVKAESTSLCLTPAPVLKWVSEQDVDTVTYCAPFEARAASCPAFVGGKGASLALLTSVQKENGYRVPPGFCITTKALEKHLEVNSDIIKAIQAIEAANENYDEKNFKEKCERTVELFASSNIDIEVKDEIILHMNNLRKKALEQGFETELRFAVRSSGVGEDSEALSAAGQNDTVLGCGSDRDVIEAVKKCWASMFAFTSAYYRRQNGQPCLCGGGVVVQVLVRPKAAGVMFTRHPDNGDPTRVLVTANYGLGESVVSGTVEPDTIIVTRGDSDELVISEIKLGSKLQRVTASESGVTSETVPESERTKPCLSVTEAISLVRIGIAQDQMWAAPRDIEWAVTENDIFLLQARPITSLERWTEEELLHELDFAIMSDDELTTFANTGEVIPKPITALTHDLILTPMEAGTCRPMIYRSLCGYDKSLIVTHNRVALALYNNIYRHVPNKIDTSLRMLEFSIHGHKVADEYIHQVAMHRREPSKLSTVFLTLNTFKLILTSKSSMIDGIRVVKSMKFNMETEDPQAIVDEIEGSLDKFARCMEDHCRTTSGSACSQLIAMLVLVEGAEDFTPEQCSEMNSLLSSGDVLSAEVPQALDTIAREIQESGKAEEFRKVNPKEAQKWLRINLPKVYQEVEMFLEKHGHRAVMEFDLITKPWVMVPEEMMEVLQNMKPAPATNKQRKTDDDVLNSLQTPQKPNTRKILRWLLPLCRRTVQHREITKAHVILGVHKLRLLVRRLGRILQKKWYLPDEDLVFHFRINELKEYLRTRDPALLKKAQQRRQYLPTWNKLKFCELSVGWVRPLQMALPACAAGDVTLAATAVCGGEVVARACVVHDLSQIQQLERGDVLITHATDIGWSPYFPLLSGIVTELGGLVSHGAVIAREYGLPCIIGAAGATEVFKTGDMVRLSGIHGIIERVQITESASDDGDVKK